MGLLSWLVGLLSWFVGLLSFLVGHLSGVMVIAAARDDEGSNGRGSYIIRASKVRRVPSGLGLRLPTIQRYSWSAGQGSW